MKLIFYRFIAVILLVIPGFAATYGFLAVKDSLFAAFGPGKVHWIKLLIGIVLFIAGVSFIGGWIFFRDRKRNYLAPRFRKKKKNRKKADL